MNSKFNQGWIWYPLFFFALIPLALGSLVNLVWMRWGNESMVWPIWFSIGIGFSYGVFSFIKDFVGIYLEDNEMAATINSVVTKTNQDNHTTKYFVLGPGGWHWLNPLWQKPVKIPLKAKKQINFDFQLSAKDDDVTVYGSAFRRPDPENIENLLLQGSDLVQIDRNLDTLMRQESQQQIEDYCSQMGYNSEDVVGNSGEIARAVKGRWIRTGEPVRCGFILDNFKIGNVDHSPEWVKARNDKKIIGALVDSAKAMKELDDPKDPDGNLSAKERVNAALVKTGDAKKTIFEMEGVAGDALSGLIGKAIQKLTKS